MEREVVVKAVESLCRHVEQLKHKTKKTQLIEDDGWVFVSAAVHQIVPGLSNRPQPIDIPHSIVGEDADVCLIVKSNREQFKEMVATGELPAVIKKILDPAKLRANFGRFEARRKLVASYDVFLVDSRIEGLMPGLLGREFFNKKKLPAPVCLTGSGVKEEISKALSRTYLRAKIGPTLVVRAAKLPQFSQDQIVDNVLAVTEGLAAMQNVGRVGLAAAPWSNIRAIFIRTSRTLALPIFQSAPLFISKPLSAVATVTEKQEKEQQ